MATTDLKLDEPGTLRRPGPIGRIVRLFFGLLCAWYVASLLRVTGNLIDGDSQIRPLLWNGIIIGLFLVSYVVNIGFSRAWKKWPAIISAGVLLSAAGIGFLIDGKFETNLLAHLVWAWEIYVFSHLGLAFFFSAVIGSPGCEMRAFHHLWSRATSKPVKEHRCPVGPLHAIDKWEARKKNP